MSNKNSGFSSPLSSYLTTASSGLAVEMQTQAMLESKKQEDAKVAEAETAAKTALTNELEEVTEQHFFESLVAGDEEGEGEELDPYFEAVSKQAATVSRADAMAGVIEWLEGTDPSADSFEAMAQGLADLDDDEGDMSKSEQAEFDATLTTMAQALVFLGVSAEMASSVADDDDDAAEKAFKTATDAKSGKDDSELIADFSVRESMMLEAVKKVIRDGKVVKIKKRTTKKRQSPAQKQALKKARMKAHSSSAKASRRKSLKKRKSTSMDK